VYVLNHNRRCPCRWHSITTTVDVNLIKDALLRLDSVAEIRIPFHKLTPIKYMRDTFYSIYLVKVIKYWRVSPADEFHDNCNLFPAVALKIILCHFSHVTHEAFLTATVGIPGFSNTADSIRPLLPLLAMEECAYRHAPRKGQRVR
jgi:hypothetical protein